LLPKSAAAQVRQGSLPRRGARVGRAPPR
jgi:hypothetical protein